MHPGPPSPPPRRGRRELRRVVLVLFALLLIPALGRGAEGDDTGGAFGLGSFLSPGKLAQPHAHLEGVTQCTECHVAGEGVTAERCLRCHEGVKAQVDSKKGFHKDKGEECTSCHPDHKGRSFTLTRFDDNAFDHSATGFHLEGAHKDTECADCHTDPDTWTGLKQECIACHEDSHGGEVGTRRLLDDCASCHDPDEWKALPLAREVFAHLSPSEADYPLEGAHAEVECESCHAEWRFLPIEHQTCTDCHDNPHRMKVGQCTDCHPTPHHWRVKGFDHELTGWMLEGEHAEVACGDCHGRHKTRRVDHEQCLDCHEDPHEGQFAPKDCSSCHDVHEAEFALVGFDHAATDFPLHGKHGDVACTECHGEPIPGHYVGVEHADCSSCHDDPHQGKFQPTPCKTCHSEQGWGVEDFDHDRTEFPLTGKHAEQECQTCHGDGNWSGLAHEVCTDCHADDNPHDDSVKPETCADCHQTTAWAAVQFDHATTAFDLAPAHTERVCADCHDKAHFAGLDPTCEGCHADTRPGSHYAGACTDCHAGAHWTPASLGDNSHAITGFPLNGAHAAATCRSCHATPGTYGDVPSTCNGCHAGDDPHQNMLGDRCEDCHVESTWARTRWRHHQTGFPLRGAHRLAACTDCHATSYVGTPTACWRCHEAQAPQDIEAHQSAFFSECDACHAPHSWAVARIPH